jgi:hypothetical protein
MSPFPDRLLKACAALYPFRSVAYVADAHTLASTVRGTCAVAGGVKWLECVEPVTGK